MPNPCSGPIRLSHYYSGGARVPSGTIGFPNGIATVIPINGRIAISNFYGSNLPKYSLSANVTVLGTGESVRFTANSDQASESLLYEIQAVIS